MTLRMLLQQFPDEIVMRITEEVLWQMRHEMIERGETDLYDRLSASCVDARQALAEHAKGTRKGVATCDG